LPFNIQRPLAVSLLSMDALIPQAVKTHGPSAFLQLFALLAMDIRVTAIPVPMMFL
jgi:hypothetical protein